MSVVSTFEANPKFIAMRGGAVGGGGEEAPPPDVYPQDCSKWVAKGGCTRNAEWMTKNCATSCAAEREQARAKAAAEERAAAEALRAEDVAAQAALQAEEERMVAEAAAAAEAEKARLAEARAEAAAAVARVQQEEADRAEREAEEQAAADPPEGGSPDDADEDEREEAAADDAERLLAEAAQLKADIAARAAAVEVVAEEEEEDGAAEERRGEPEAQAGWPDGIAPWEADDVMEDDRVLFKSLDARWIRQGVPADTRMTRWDAALARARERYAAAQIEPATGEEPEPDPSPDPQGPELPSSQVAESVLRIRVRGSHTASLTTLEDAALDFYEDVMVSRCGDSGAGEGALTAAGRRLQPPRRCQSRTTPRRWSRARRWLRFACTLKQCSARSSGESSRRCCRMPSSASSWL